jgi:hypothetical protein
VAQADGELEGNAVAHHLGRLTVRIDTWRCRTCGTAYETANEARVVPTCCEQPCAHEGSGVIAGNGQHLDAWTISHRPGSAWVGEGGGGSSSVNSVELLVPEQAQPVGFVILEPGQKLRTPAEAAGVAGQAQAIAAFREARGDSISDAELEIIGGGDPFANPKLALADKFTPDPRPLNPAEAERLRAGPESRWDPGWLALMERAVWGGTYRCDRAYQAEIVDEQLDHVLGERWQLARLNVLGSRWAGALLIVAVCVAFAIAVDHPIALVIVYALLAGRIVASRGRVVRAKRAVKDRSKR